MLATSLLSYVLPLSLLQSAPLSPRQHSRPTPSHRISPALSFAQRWNPTNHNSTLPSLIYQSGTIVDQEQSAGLLVKTDGHRKVTEEERETEAVYFDTEEGDDEDVDWYYSAADEVERVQEMELWKQLLGRKDGRIPDLFKELLVDEPRARTARSNHPFLNAKRPLTIPNDSTTSVSDARSRNDL